jgi:electron transport complex protein RnfG
MTISAVLLGLFAIVGTTLLALTNEATAPRIAANQREVVLKKLHVLIPPEQHDNDLFADAIEVTAPDYLGTEEPVAVYRARREGEPVAAIIASVAPDGYNGNIYLLVAVRQNGVLAGVQVARHRETPGLGDGIDARKSDWINTFTGRSLGDPPPKDWNVKRDGGVFDQLTGATITPRAVVKAVHRTLEYFQVHRNSLFAPLPADKSAEDKP